MSPVITIKSHWVRLHLDTSSLITKDEVFYLYVNHLDEGFLNPLSLKF